MASRQDLESGRAFVRLYLKNDMSRQLAKSLRAAQARLRSFGQSAVNMGRSFAIAGTAMSAPFALSVRTFASFDDAMREVGGVTQAVGADFDMLTEKAKALGASTSYTASEVALLMAELGRAGFVPRQINEMTGAVLSLARATKTEAAKSAGFMSAAIRQFSLETGDAAHVADVLTTGANKSFNTLETLGEALEKAGPVANDFNLSLEDTVAVLGTLGNVGIQGSEAGTSLRRIMLALGADAEKVGKIFGVNLVDAKGDAINVVDALQLVAEATRGMGTSARAAKFQQAFGLRGITGASAIGKSIVGTRDLRDAIEKAGGSAEKTAAMMDSGLGGEFRILKSAVEGVQIAIGEALQPALTRIVKSLTKAAQSAIEWIKNNKEIVVVAAAVGAGLISAGIALIGVGMAAQVAAFAIGGLATAVGVILSPIGLLIASLAAGAVAWVTFSDSGKQAWESLKAAAPPIIETLKTAFGGIKDAIASGDWEMAGKIAMAGLKLAFLQGLAAIQQAFPNTFRTVLVGTGKILDGLVKLFGIAMGALKDQWNSWGKKVLETVLLVSGKVVGVWQKAVSGMANWMLETSAKGGAMGKAMSAVLGVDMAEEQKRAQKLEEGLAKAQGREPGQVDVLADAKRDVERITKQWEADAKAGLESAGKSADQFMQGLPKDVASDMAGALDRFVKGLESGKSVGEAAKELAALRAEAARRKEESAKEQQKAEGLPGDKGTSGPSAASGAVGAPAPRGVALTATYSAAAASISGYQPSGPEEKMAAGIDKVGRGIDGMIVKQGEQTVEIKVLRQSVEQFLAGWKVS